MDLTVICPARYAHVAFYVGNKHSEVFKKELEKNKELFLPFEMGEYINLNFTDEFMAYAVKKTIKRLDSPNEIKSTDTIYEYVMARMQMLSEIPHEVCAKDFAGKPNAKDAVFRAFAFEEKLSIGKSQKYAGMLLDNLNGDSQSAFIGDVSLCVLKLLNCGIR